MLLELVELAREADADVTYANVLPEKVGHLVSCVSSSFTFESLYDASPTSFRSCHVRADVRIAV